MSEFYRPPSVRTPRASRRRGSWKGAAALVLFVLGAGGAVFGGWVALRVHPRFTVKRVVLEGVPDARRSETEELTDAWIGKPLLFVDIESALARLSARPWVASAAARRIVPDTVAVCVFARPAVALARRGDALWTIDRAGTWLGPYAGRAVSRADDFVLLDVSASGEDASALARGAAFVEALRNEDPALLARASEVEVLKEGFAVVDKSAKARLLFGRDASERGRAAPIWRAFLALRPELERHSIAGAEVDLRFADRIVLKAPSENGGRGNT